MLTNTDIQKLKTIFTASFVTKDEFNALRADFQELLFEVRKFNDELLVSNYRQSRHTDILDTHEERLTALEKKMGLYKKS